MLKRLRKTIRNLLSGSDLYINHQIRSVERIFAYEKDFLINYAGDVITIEFNSSMGYLPTWPYVPRFYWDSGKKAWHVNINEISFYTIGLPLFELINELRGYLLLGDLHTGDTVIDGGTSSGISSMYFAKRIGPTGKLICLEPDPRAMEGLYENIKINNLGNVIVLQKGLSDKSGTSLLSIDNVGASRIADDSSGDSGSSISIEVVSLDELVRQYDFDRIDFIKMDIEGAEVRVIEQIISLLATHPRLIIAIASYHECSGKKASSWIQEWIEEKNLDIEVKTVYPHHETTFLLNRENVNMTRRLREIRPYAG